MHPYTCRFTLQEGGQSLAKKKSIHKWLDQALCKPKKKLKERNGNVKTTILTHVGLQTIDK
jgi:hypothetical protein